jgi:hypothetical protein
LGVKFPTTQKQVDSFRQEIENKIESLGEFEIEIPKSQIDKWEGDASTLIDVLV